MTIVVDSEKASIALLGKFKNPNERSKFFINLNPFLAPKTQFFIFLSILEKRAENLANQKVVIGAVGAVNLRDLTYQNDACLNKNALRKSGLSKRWPRLPHKNN